MALMQGAMAQYSGCPEQYGVQTYPHDQYCDKFYLCVNGKDKFSYSFNFFFSRRVGRRRSFWLGGHQ